MVRRILIPALLALWGAAIVLHHLAAKPAAHANGAYAGGQSAAAVFGAVMAVAGTVYVVRALRGR